MGEARGGGEGGYHLPLYSPLAAGRNVGPFNVSVGCIPPHRHTVPSCQTGCGLLMNTMLAFSFKTMLRCRSFYIAMYRTKIVRKKIVQCQ